MDGARVKRIFSSTAAVERREGDGLLYKTEKF